MFRIFQSCPIQPVCRAFAMSAVLLAGRGLEATTIVVPPELENVEANLNFAKQPLSPPGARLQELHLASEFAAMDPSPGVLVQMAFRPDKDITAPRTCVLYDFELRLSTTDRGPGNLDSHFDDNFGDDTTVVYSGDLTWSTQGSGPPGGPRPFDYVIEFQDPFVYDPSAGNLLIDWRTSSIPGSGPYIDGERYYDGLTRSLFALSRTATDAFVSFDTHQPLKFFVASPADFDKDGDVDGDDFLAWQASFGVDAGGDADGDGDTDGDDFLTWQTEFGSSNGAASAAVPEPASAILVLAVAFVGILSHRGRFSSSLS